MKILFIKSIAILMISLSMAGYAADDPLTPMELKGGRIITADEAKNLIGRARFYDMRKPLNYGKGHLPGAYALPYEQKSEKNTDFNAALDKFEFKQLPADKSTQLVFYSDGPTGWKSYKAAVIAIRHGYTDVMRFRGGAEGWQTKGYSFDN